MTDGDPWQDLLSAADLIRQMPHRKTLHCARDIADEFAAVALPPPAIVPGLELPGLLGIDIIPEPDWAAGRWELREGEVVVAFGEPARRCPAEGDSRG